MAYLVALVNRFDIGRFSIELEYREVEGDQGLTLHVYGPAHARTQEILRFDCFDGEPHYHLAWEYEQNPFVLIEDKDPFMWAIRKLGKDMPKLLGAANAEAMRERELNVLADRLVALEQSGLELRRNRQ